MQAILLEGEAKEIAALVLEIRERRGFSRAFDSSKRDELIREYEHRLARLKDGASPADVIF